VSQIEQEIKAIQGGTGKETIYDRDAVEGISY